jgi:hypothetical protein
MKALSEARRVLRDDGVLFAAGISRFAALLDLLIRVDRLHDPAVLAMVADAVTTGIFRGSDAGLFTNAYFHRPQELAEEICDADFTDPRLYNIEGPGFVVPDFEARWQDPARREAMMEAARLVETDVDMLAAAGHLLAVADRNGAG